MTIFIIDTVHRNELIEDVRALPHSTILSIFNNGRTDGRCPIMRYFIESFNSDEDELYLKLKYSK